MNVRYVCEPDHIIHYLLYIFCSKLLSCCTDEKINGVEIIEDQSFPAVLELGLLAVYLGGFGNC